MLVDERENEEIVLYSVRIENIELEISWIPWWSGDLDTYRYCHPSRWRRFSFFLSLRNSIVHFWKIFTKLMIIDSSNSRKRKVERISDRMNFCYQFSSRANKTFSINLIMKTETGRAINPSFLAVLYKISIISLFILFDIFFINNNCAKRRKRNYD